jgi:hypothetical protein
LPLRRSDSRRGWPDAYDAPKRALNEFALTVLLDVLHKKAPRHGAFAFQGFKKSYDTTFPETEVASRFTVGLGREMTFASPPDMYPVDPNYRVVMQLCSSVHHVTVVIQPWSI